jgi:sugar phosphate permease
MNRRTLFQAVIFCVAYATYASFYLTRKPLSIIKAALVSYGIPVWILGLYDSVFLLVYSLGQFFSGYEVDKYGSKVVVVVGLLVTSFATSLAGVVGLDIFALSPYTVALLFGILWTFNSFGQSLGWSPCVKTITVWFEEYRRGTIFGFYSTCSAAGSFLGTILAVNLLATRGWQYAMIVPSIITLVVGVLDFFFWIADPAKIGIEIIHAAPELLSPKGKKRKLKKSKRRKNKEEELPQPEPAQPLKKYVLFYFLYSCHFQFL